MSDSRRILIVEDDTTVAEVVTRYLQRAGFEVSVAGDGLAGLDLARATSPDLVVLDLMLPGMSGLDVCRALRETSDIPIIMLTALSEDTDRITGLEVGADDYLTKPFSPRELVLRIESVLRRVPPQPMGAPVLASSGIEVDAASHEARRDGQALALTAREFDLLVFLVGNPGRTFRRKELLREVWGWEFGDQSTVTVHVRRLREKVETDPGHPTLITTVWGVGYRWDGT